MKSRIGLSVVLLVLLVTAGCGWGYKDKKGGAYSVVSVEYRAQIEKLVYDQAKAWETGDIELLKSTMHPDIVFAYPGRRLNFDQVVEDLEYYKDHFANTKVYIHNIIIDGDMVAVEWQFASDNLEKGKRTAVSDGIIGKIKDGKIIMWKEYLDGRVSRSQLVDELPLEEGEEPFPTPNKPKKN